MKTDLFQSCGPCWVLQSCWHIECSIFTASSFRIWNSSTGIPSPLLALFVVMLPKAHLTSHSRMSGSRWVITPSWLSGSWRSFLYSSSVYSCHLFLTSSASVRSVPFLSFIEPIFAWNVPLVSLIFLKRSLVFPILLFSSISLHWSLRKAFLSLLAILWNSAFRCLYLSFSPLLFTSLPFTAFSFHFFSVFSQKTLESPLDCKEIQPVHPKGDQSWVFIGGTDVEAETPVLWPPDVKSWLIGKDPDAGKDWGQEENGTTEDKMVGWHHWLHGHAFEQAPGVGDGQGGLACCSPWGRKELDTTEWLNWIIYW